MRHRALLTTLAAGAILLASGPAGAQLRLEEARIFIEFNDSDQDVGAHVFLDGDAWKRMRIFDPNGNLIFNLFSLGSLGEIGLSELFFEGEEPTLDELPLDEFFERFPEGKYLFKGETPDGERISRIARFSHRIPGAPVIVSPPEGGTVDPDDAVIQWLQVTTPAGVEIAGYQVIVGSFQVTLDADQTSVTIPSEFLAPGRRYGFEVLSIEENHNQTITQGSFVTE